MLLLTIGAICLAIWVSLLPGNEHPADPWHKLGMVGLLVVGLIAFGSAIAGASR